MNKKLFIVIALLILALPVVAAKRKTPNNRLIPGTENLGTEFDFSGSSVMGKYRQAGEGASIVENEKSLQPLVQPRKKFQDRMKTSVRWNQ